MWGFVFLCRLAQKWSPPMITEKLFPSRGPPTNATPEEAVKGDNKDEM